MPSEAPPAAPVGPLYSPMLGHTAAISNGSFVVAEWQDAGGVFDTPHYIAPLHVHHKDEEAWYVLEGTLRFMIGGSEIEAPAGSAVLAPPGVSHTFWNPGPGPARYLIVMTTRTHQLIQALHALPVRTRETVAALFREYDCELL